MKISEIYEKFSIPPNLREHMLTVTKVAIFIFDHWIGDKLDKSKIQKISLVHDLGNIVKFNFEKNPKFLGGERGNIQYWIEKQKEIVSKYGNDDHNATKSMLNELGFDDTSSEVIASKSFGNSVETQRSNDWYLKILLYSDMRVLPWGVGTLQERFDDIVDRMPQYNTRPDLEDLFNACRDIEKEIQKHVSIDLETINNETINSINSEELLSFDVSMI